jgi:hypothetical protein
VRVFKCVRCGSGSRWRSLGTTIRALWMEIRRGLDQKGAESSAGWPKAGWAFTQDRQCTHVRDTDAYICNMAVQSRQIRTTLRRSLLYQRCCCPRRRTTADRSVNFWARPAGDFRAGCFRHYRAFRTTALHGVHRVVAGSHHGKRRYCRKNDEQSRNEFGESSHACDSEVTRAGISRL